MGTAFLICVGSRGDTEPLTALTVALLNDPRFDKVHFCLQPQYRALVPNDDRIIIHDLPLSMNSMTFVFAWHLFKEKILSFFRWENVDIIRAQCAALTSYVSRVVAPTLPKLNELVTETRPSLILATSLGGVVGSTVADCGNIPFFLLHMQPNTPTSSFPFYLSNVSNSRVAAGEISAVFNNENEYRIHESYLSTYETQVDFHMDSLRLINPFRRDRGLPEMTRDDVATIFRGEKENQHVLQSYPARIIPAPRDWSNNIHIIPPLADSFIPPDWIAETQCPLLKEFLNQGEKPVCITLGSVAVSGREAPALQNMLGAFQTSNVQRLVIIEGAAGLGEELLQNAEEELLHWSREHVFWCSESVQYAWLFPQCHFVFCHGGAGTVSTALRAGIPIGIVPIMSDQFFWGDLMQRVGVGAFLDKGLTSSTLADFRKAIDTISSVEVQRKAFDYGVTVKSGTSGISAAVTVLGSSFS
ncbi:hypothetical protein FGB62_6g331 [Gracilaria domingensis]|nr:hypothetical protein FGB62_6g331 [Gracilaria domingensis]